MAAPSRSTTIWMLCFDLVVVFVITAMIPIHHFVLLLALSVTGLVSAQTWCGKNYMNTAPIIPPGGQFIAPAISSDPLLAFRCGPATKPYLPADVADHSNAVSILVDTLVTFREVSGSVPLVCSDASTLEVTVTLENGRILTQGQVPMNTTKFSLDFDLSAAGLEPRVEPYAISCTAEGGYEAKGEITFLPEVPSDIGSVTKMDMRTGALLARKDDAWETVFPVGFYTNFNYLARNLSVLGELKRQGFTVVHPVPTFDNLTALAEVVEEMDRVGLYLMYDMRWTYMNDTAVAEEVNRIKSHPNLLLWYTADEPDGTSDPLNATSLSYDLIHSLDPYHPVSLVLNCENYFFTEYSSGAEILMQDTYMIGNNVTWSEVWDTPCTQDYGDCGCDNCVGEFEDIGRRMDEFFDRIWVNGWVRGAQQTVWTVPQAFGQSSYWKRYPTGKEWVAQSILGVNHGAMGVVSWDDPTGTPEIKAAASALALALLEVNHFFLDPRAEWKQVMIGAVDVGMWELGGETLLLASNTNYTGVTAALLDFGLGTFGNVRQVLDSGAKVIGNDIVFEGVGSSVLVAH